MTELKQRLPDGPLDLIGDVHGEYDALRALVHNLGGDLEAGRVIRPLVFVGDLVDRGPDSVAVLRAYERLAERGLAYCVLGNHELNLLRNDSKEGNGWFLPKPDKPRDEFQFESNGRHEYVAFHSVPVKDEEERERINRLIKRLPITLEREDLRVVHAAWLNDAIEQLGVAIQDFGAAEHAGEWANRFDQQTAAKLEAEGVSARARQERALFDGLKSKAKMPDRFLHHVAEDDEQTQNRNPIRLLTSGPEKRITSHHEMEFLGGKWRFLRRDDWWKEYRDETPVVVGHYWRSRVHDTSHKKQGWPAASASHWHGAQRNVFCVDYSVGRRYHERHTGVADNFHGGLAALRWPERMLVFDDRPEAAPTLGFREA